MATTVDQEYLPTTEIIDENAKKDEPPMSLDIVINNVVSTFNLRCHLDLRQIALNGANVQYRRSNGMVSMKIRKPYSTASIWSSGKITCTGATSEEMAKVAARRFARIIQNLGYRKASLNNFRVVNVLGTCTMPFGIKIMDFSMNNRQNACYEPELHPGVTYKIKDPKATLKIFSTGSITVTAPSIYNIQKAIEHIFPIVFEYKSPRVIPNNVKSINRHNNRRYKPVEEDSDDDFSCGES